MDGSMLDIRKFLTNSADGGVPQKMRYQVEQTNGSFEIDIGELGQHLEVCVQSYKASLDLPSRVSIALDTIKSNTEIASEKLSIAIKQHETIVNEQRKLIEENKLLQKHTSQITADLLRMKQRTEAIVGEIDYSKQTEQQFFDMSINLNNAVKYYPMARVLIIFMAGYMQVNYVIQYMKTKRIY
jgi:emp24/gp25L/p24 family/GOLD